LPKVAEDPAFQLAVRSVLDEVEWEKEQQQEAERAQRQSARVERQTARLTEALKLNPEQVSEVSAIFTEQAEQLRSLRVQRRELSEPSTPQQRQEQFAQLRRQADERLRQTLTPEQFASYEKLAEEGGFGFDFGGRRRPVSAENPAR
jgi:seryl-tRNA synthetase